MSLERNGDNVEHAHAKNAVRDSASKTMGSEVSDTNRTHPRTDFAPTKDTAAQHLPNVQIVDSAATPKPDAPDQRVQTLTDSNARPEDRLAAAQQLSKEGVNKLDLQNDKGEKYSLRLSTAKAGSREMVNVHQEGGGESDKPLLRGVANKDGSFEQQKNSRGQFVDWHGSAKEKGGSASATDSPVAKTSDNSADTPSRVHSRHEKSQDRPSFDTAPAQKLSAPNLEEKIPALNKPDAQKSTDGATPSVNPNPTASEAHRLMDKAAQIAGHPTGKLVNTEHGLYMRAKFDVDADGSPNVRKLDPHDGQAKTSLRYAGHDAKSVNAEEVPYVVLPKGQYKGHGVQVGDMALVRNKDNGKMAVAVFGDVGPGHKRGEGSMALARDLGLDSSPRHGGTQQKNIEYLAIPNSGGAKARNQEELVAKMHDMEQRLGIR